MNKKEPVYSGYEFDTPEFREKQKTLMARKAELKRNRTSSEAKIKSMLDELNIRYIEQKAFIAYDYYCIVDFYFPAIKLCLEIDGGYHNTPEQKAKDARRDKYLTETRGFQVCRITNEQADKLIPNYLLDILRSYTKDRRIYEASLSCKGKLFNRKPKKKKRNSFNR